MALTQNFNVNPYYDDFDETKGYNRILFRPGHAVQARELTQLQTMMQKQIERFGSHIFKEGSMVLGGQTNYENSGIFYIKLQDTNSSGVTVNPSDFVGKFIKKVGSNEIRAYVLTAENKTSTDPKTIAVKYLSSERFSNSDSIEDETQTFTALVATSSGSGPCSIITVNDGVFFIDGFFAKVNSQTIFLDKYGTTPTYRIGLEVSDTIVNESEDTSLLDPALDASNYQAPGATRLKIELTLSKRTLSSTDDSKFIDLIRIENGVIKSRNIYPQYSVLEDTLARRTFDESGDYTVTPFNVKFTDDFVSNNGVGFANAFNIIISPGKAYVKGYEFETISPTTLVAERSRDFQTEFNYGLTINYQNYVDITNISGPIDVKEFTKLDVHCVPHQSINTTSNVSIAATNIGTIRIRALDYQYGANTTSTSNAVYRAYVFEPNIGVISANATGGTANSITLHNDASSQNNAYYGVKLRIFDSTGNSESKVVQSYNGVTKVATFDSTWTIGTPSTNTIFSLDFEFKDSESFIKTNGANNITTKVNISQDSKYSSLIDVYESAYITEPQFEAIAFLFPKRYIKENSITNNEYFARKVYTGTFTSAGVFGSSGGFQTSSGAGGITSAVTGSPISSTDAIDNFFVVLTSDGTTLANNSVINFLQPNNRISVTTSSNTSVVTITCPGANNASATVYMKVKLPYPEELPTGAPIRKVKTEKVANTTIVSVLGGENINGSNVVLYVNETDQPGVQLVVKKDFIANLKNSNLTQSLYVPDVFKLSKVLDFKNYAPTTANIANALDITTSFSLLNGRTINAYNHSEITLKPGTISPTGNVVIYADYYEHTGSGYHTVDSYIQGGIEYKNIPLSLRDTLDFRPKLKTGVDGINGVYEESLIGISGTNFETDFAYYLARIDKLVVTKDRRFEIIQGISSPTPKIPSDRNDSMTIYTLIMPPYVSEVSQISTRFTENRRYTMRDIGKIEKRVQNLEYFSTLSLLEKKALGDTFIDDSTGLSRVKTGVVTDPFKNFNTADLMNEDYLAAVDLDYGTVRPAFSTSTHSFELAPENINDAYSTTVSLNATTEVFVTQPQASSIISVNPNGVNFSLAGSVTVEPTPTPPDPIKPPVIIDNPGNVNGNWAACAKRYELQKAKNNLDKHNKALKQQYSKEIKDLGKDIQQIEKLTKTDVEGEKYQWGYKCIKGEWKWWEYVIEPDPPYEDEPGIPIDTGGGGSTTGDSTGGGSTVPIADLPGYDSGGGGFGDSGVAGDAGTGSAAGDGSSSSGDGSAGGGGDGGGGSGGGACFLTTATVQALKLEDDCKELRIARMLRDEKMTSDKDRIAIDLYYKISPTIVSRKKNWKDFYENAIIPIVKLVEQKKYKEAVRLYKYQTVVLVDEFIGYKDQKIIEDIFDTAFSNIQVSYLIKYMFIKTFLKYKKCKLKIWKWRIDNGFLWK